MSTAKRYVRRQDGGVADMTVHRQDTPDAASGMLAEPRGLKKVVTLFSGSLRRQLIWAFALILALLFAVLTVALDRFNTLTTRMQDFVNEEARISFLADKANMHTQNAAIHLMQLLQTLRKDQRVPLYLAMDDALNNSDLAVQGLGRAYLSDKGKSDVEKLAAVRTEYGVSFQETVELIEIEGLISAREHYEKQTAPLLKTLRSLTSEIAAEQQELMQQEIQQMEAELIHSRMVVWIISTMALLAGVTLALLIARNISRQVRQAVTVAEVIAGGNYMSAVPKGRSAEIGALMRALEKMRASIASREKHVLNLAYVDMLTNLPNRTRFLEIFSQFLKEFSGSLILLDINRFSQINNALGHKIGDRVIIEVAQRLQQGISAQSILARLGGDEFIMLIPETDKEAISIFAQGLLEKLRQPVMLDGQKLDIDASLGIVSFATGDNSITKLLRRADLAMSIAKRRHQGYAFGTEIADEPGYEQLTLLGEMRKALEENEFRIYYQPKQEVASGELSGAEALLRWHHPEKGIIPPGRFIPFAEQTGFIREITPWILKNTVDQAVIWHRAGMNIVISVNISALDLLNPALVTHIQKLLENSGLPPRLICLEITESALMDDPEEALRQLNELAALGLKLAVDDYGAGQASLAYVQRLPVHELKIDQVFVKNVDQLLKNAAIIRSTILLCHDLGLSVVAEGVETSQEMEWLKQNKCAIAQGYGIARPMPVQDFSVWMNENSARLNPYACARK